MDQGCVGDPGCVKYYAEMKRVRERINAILLPMQGRVTYVGHSNGSMNAIWYMGKSETGFASGRDEIAVVDRILEQFCKGL